MNNLIFRFPRCDAERLRSWPELDAEQQEVVRRLPASANVSLEARKARHRWCTQCWFEESGDAPLDI